MEKGIRSIEERFEELENKFNSLVEFLDEQTLTQMKLNNAQNEHIKMFVNSLENTKKITNEINVINDRLKNIEDFHLNK